MRIPYRYPFPKALLGQFENITVTNTATINLLIATGQATMAGIAMSGNLSLTGGGTITSSVNGNITLAPNGTGITTIGSGVSSGYGLNSNNDLLINGKVEVNGVGYFADYQFLTKDSIYRYNAGIILGLLFNTKLSYNTNQVSGNTLTWGLANTSCSLIITTYNNHNHDHDHSNQSHPTLFIHSATDPDINNHRWMSFNHNNYNAVYKRGVGVHQFDAPIRFSSSFYYTILHTEVFSLDPGVAGATFVAPDANTLGGFQLDADTEFLYFSKKVYNNWNASTDLEVFVSFEVNVNNTAGGGGDTVDLSLACWYKGYGETVNKTQVIEVANVVGQSAQYKQFTTTFTINHDLVDHVVQVGDKLSFRLHLETDTSEVDDIIITHAHCRYKTAKISYEV